MSRGWLLFMLLLAAMPGCKKKAPPPPPTPQVAPLPKKPQQAQAAAPANAVQPRVSTAKKPAIALPVQKQLSTAKRLQPAGTAVNLDFTNRRDPFRPFVQAPAAQQSAGKVSRSRVRDPLPIQSFDTERFRVSGIVTGLKQNSALVIDPSGKGYVVKEGMPLGNNDGFVKRVTNTTVEVEESFRDDNGRVRKRLVKLTLIRKK